MAGETAPATVDEYVAGFPAPVQEILQRIRATVKAAAPDAEEVISYRMPAFRQGGILLYVGAFKHHVGIFPPVSGDPELERDLAVYAGEKGNLRLPLDQPIPYALIERIVKLRLRQAAAKGARKRRR